MNRIKLFPMVLATLAFNPLPLVSQVDTMGTDTARVETTDTAKPKKSLFLLRSKQDTVLLVRNGDINHLISSISENLERTRRHGYGGAGGPSTGLIFADMGPVRDIVTNSTETKDKDFGINRFGLVMSTGGLGYGGIGNGIRIGGGGYGGNTGYSAHYVNNGRDSVAFLNINYGAGGMLIEKAMVRDRFNFILGGSVGGGGYDISLQAIDKDSISAFNPNTSYKLSDVQIKGFNLGLYGGMTYTVLSWFHVGGDVSLNSFIGKANPAYSIQAITGKNTFFSFSPGIKLRFIFGNLG